MKTSGLVGMEIRNKFCYLFHNDKHSKTQGWGVVVYEKGEVREE